MPCRQRNDKVLPLIIQDASCHCPLAWHNITLIDSLNPGSQSTVAVERYVDLLLSVKVKEPLLISERSPQSTIQIIDICISFNNEICLIY
jgi:hypothetical protein